MKRKKDLAYVNPWLKISKPMLNSVTFDIKIINLEGNGYY
jgi:hypothetical protein